METVSPEPRSPFAWLNDAVEVLVIFIVFAFVYAFFAVIYLRTLVTAVVRSVRLVTARLKR